LKEHRILTGIGICLFVGAVVFSGGLALGLAPIAIVAPTVFVATSVAGLYSTHVIKKDEQLAKNPYSIDEISNSKGNQIEEGRAKEISEKTVKPTIQVNTMHADKILNDRKQNISKQPKQPNQLSP
jgi:hypothetical protein